MITQRLDILGGLQVEGSVVNIFDLGKYVGSATGTLLLIAGIATFFYLVFGGLQWVLAGGDKGKLDSAKQMITNAIIGLTVTASAYAIFAIIQWYFGLNIVNLEKIKDGNEKTPLKQDQLKPVDWDKDKYYVL
ncbi:MAG: hypothetical protein UX04_C0002G0034 [Microgenomates group bacterium GW2011_GWF2_45_18]|nr:MAG: hypothetical protein UW18_C0001G0063 [Microgenomates group bacterium GW2011_GWF1_44_10]KKU01891.1 MAG: hypothetical protein UX04_C0002G0034 [Microgenomates group bacterium GW2011_GWF2_45_18]OGJ40258.1 MAG: hypothetical protein A2378_03505 [Candidatus Pacebacteria bacterium RIFOXYB1_FULL_44_10]HAU98792.1 hypothetical protein [Candidatus Paceibacterota bacterium]HAX01388.1 hypothetical protein [Candidatus Paceibacterota bacterium]